MEEAINAALVYMIGQLPVAFSVLLTVQALKVFDFVGPDKQRVSTPQAAILSGLFFGLGALASSLFPDSADVITQVNTYVVGSLSAGLLYKYILKTLGGAVWAATQALVGNLANGE